MKAILRPLYFECGMDEEFNKHLNLLKDLLKDDAEILKPVEVGKSIGDVDGALFPQLLGYAFRRINTLKKINLPIIITTSDFGAVNMWDWEIVTFLKSGGLNIFAPYNLELTKKICRSLALKRDMKKTKFLMFQDHPGEGMQGEIFKRFYWWEKRSEDLMKKKFGITIVKKSFKKMAASAKKITDRLAEAEIKRWDIPSEGVSQTALKNAYKIYIAVKEEVEKDPSIKGAGINCLNESFFSNTTPCLAWSILYEEKGLVWACEADTMSLLTKYIINKSLGADIIMSNVYPFLMGRAALQHERIDRFPEVDEPENHLLIAHCGYFGLTPRCMAEKWVLREKVLAIVDDDATVIDARLPAGDVIITKLHPGMDQLLAAPGKLTGYVQYPDSDCRNGGIIKVKDGYRMMDLFFSHHSCIAVGNRMEEFKYMAKVFDLEIVN
jgi:hypothetical protein